jgi:hypothetical protein
MEKRLEFSSDGTLRVSYRWNPSLAQPGDFFTTELSLFAPLDLTSEPAADIWSFPIETVAKSERGLDRTRQGDSTTFRWPVHLERASLRIQVAGREETSQPAGPATESILLPFAGS